MILYFRTYAPVAFRYFRDLFGIPPDDFMVKKWWKNKKTLIQELNMNSDFYLQWTPERAEQPWCIGIHILLNKWWWIYSQNCEHERVWISPKIIAGILHELTTESTYNFAKVFRHVLLSMQPKEHPPDRHEQPSSIKCQNAFKVWFERFNF